MPKLRILHHRLFVRSVLISLIAVAAAFVVIARLPAPEIEPFPSVIIPQDVRGRMKLFVLAGQSNMSGAGKDPSTFDHHPQIFLFGNDYRWHQAVEPLDNPAGQVDIVARDPYVGVGPGLAFAHTLLLYDADTAIGLIPCALSGSPIDLWRRDLSDDTLYGSCLKRVRAASPMGSVAGVLFFQGETDAGRPDKFPWLVLSPHTWAEQFAMLVAAWRMDFDADNLPVVFAQIGSAPIQDPPLNWAVVQAEQASIVLPDVMMVKTDDLPRQDRLHFTTASYEIIGQRFAEVYLAIVTSGSQN